MKKILCLVLAILMLVALAACNGDNGGSTKDPSGKPTIKIALLRNVQVRDYEDNVFTKWVEEQSGVNLEFMTLEGTQTDAQTQFSTMVTSGERLPDIVMGFGFPENVWRSYGMQGYFIDLKPYFDDAEMSKPWWDNFANLPKDMQDYTMHTIKDETTGAYYSVPAVSYSEWDVLLYQPWINQNWLDTLGKKVPTNTEELIDVLTAFRDGDPNGNNQKDEIPCIGTTSNYGGNMVSWLVNMKMYCNSSTWVEVDDKGNIYAPATTDEYREALKWVKSLMDQGLVSTLAITTKNAGLKSMLAAGDMVGIAVCHPNLVMPSAEDMEKWTPIPYWGNVAMTYNGVDYNVFVTEDCEDPEAAFKVLMTLCTQEADIRARYGAPGDQWDYADEGALSMKGTPAMIKVYRDVYGDAITNTLWRVNDCGCAGLRSMDHHQVFDTTTVEYKADAKYLQMIQNGWNAAETNNPDLICPRLLWTEDLEKQAPHRNDVTDLFKNYTAKFVTGQLNPASDKDWNDYLDELKLATFDTWLATCQKVLNKMKQDGTFQLPQ